MKSPKSYVDSYADQAAAFIKLAYDIMDDDQVEETMERWKAICAEHGWLCDARSDESINAETEKAIDRALGRTTKQAGV